MLLANVLARLEGVFYLLIQEGNYFFYTLLVPTLEYMHIQRTRSHVITEGKCRNELAAVGGLSGHLFDPFRFVHLTPLYNLYKKLQKKM